MYIGTLKLSPNRETAAASETRSAYLDVPASLLGKDSISGTNVFQMSMKVSKGIEELGNLGS